MALITSLMVAVAILAVMGLVGVVQIYLELMFD
jgi:hypothetical protein